MRGDDGYAQDGLTRQPVTVTTPLHRPTERRRLAEGRRMTTLQLHFSTHLVVRFLNYAGGRLAVVPSRRIYKRPRI